VPPLLPEARCALTAPFHPCLCSRGSHRRSALCCTFRRLSTPGRYPAPCPAELGLSSTRSCRAAIPLASRIFKQCPGEDSNLHAVSGTRSLVWPVYQFQHLGSDPSRRTLRRPRTGPSLRLPDSAPERTRTSTGLRPLDPESSASTNSATGARTNHLNHRDAPGEIRTPDLLIRSQTLYPAELRAHEPTADRKIRPGMHPVGIEPTTLGLRVPCSAN
jgi:hypothetical protein